MANDLTIERNVVQVAISSAAVYLVGCKGLGFDEIEKDMQELITCILAQTPGFRKCSLKLHVHPDETYFDIGIVFGDNRMYGARLVEVERGVKTATTLH